jgi:hypothetical protein
LLQPCDSGCSGISSDKSCIIILTCVTHIDDILLGIVNTPFFLAVALFFLFFYFCQYSDIQDIDHVSFSSSKIIVWLLVDKAKLNVIGRLGIIDLEFESLKVMMLFMKIFRYHY